MTTAKELCLSVVECFIAWFWKETVSCTSTQSPDLSGLNFSKCRHDVSNSPEIMKKLTSKFKDIGKVFPFNKNDFLALRGYVT